MAAGPRDPGHYVGALGTTRQAYRAQRGPQPGQVPPVDRAPIPNRRRGACWYLRDRPEPLSPADRRSEVSGLRADEREATSRPALKGMTCAWPAALMTLLRSFAGAFLAGDRDDFSIVTGDVRW